MSNLPYWKQGLKDQPKPERSTLLAAQTYHQHGKQFFLSKTEPDGDDQYQAKAEMALQEKSSKSNNSGES